MANEAMADARKRAASQLDANRQELSRVGLDTEEASKKLKTAAAAAATEAEKIATAAAKQRSGG